jgi:hypothetical protein
MAQRPSILLSREAAEAIKKRYAARGEKLTASGDLARGATVHVTDASAVNAMAKASPDARLSTYRQLMAKTALNQGEQDVKLSLEMLGTAAQYKAARMRREKEEAQFRAQESETLSRQISRGTLDSEIAVAEQATKAARLAAKDARFSLGLARADAAAARRGFIAATDFDPEDPFDRKVQERLFSQFRMGAE